MSTILDKDFYDYKIGVKREIVNALKPLFGADFPIPEFRNNVYVGLEYPMTEVDYPAIYITYRERTLKSAGLGHVEYTVDDGGTPFQAKRFYFDGQVSFNIIALSQGTRDRLASALINVLAFGETMPEFTSFWEDLDDSDYVDVQLNKENIYPGGDQTGGVPWNNPDEMQFATTYSLDALGTFAVDPTTGGIIKISTIIVQPYLEGTTPPW
jgi:hypothetical protein